MENKNQTVSASAQPFSGSVAQRAQPLSSGASNATQQQNDSRYYPIENLESPSTATLDRTEATTPHSSSQPTSPFTNQFTSATQPPPPAPKGRRRAIAGIVLVAIAITTLAGWLFLRNNQQAQQQLAQEVPEQALELEPGDSGLAGLAIEAADSQVLINGNIVTRGSLYVSASPDSAFGQLIADSLSENQEYILPNASGTFCLDSNNCGFATTADGIGSLVAGTGIAITGNTIINTQTITDVTETSLNSLNGNITLQGTINRIGVMTNNGVITLTSPQDIAVTSSPTFSSITLTGVGTQNGNVLCDISNNCGYAGGGNAFVQGGNSFGALAVLGTNDNFGLAFETGGNTQATLSTTGAFTLQNTTDSISGFQVLDADGGTPILNVDTTNEWVGIGTATPLTTLHVVDNSTSTTAAAEGAVLITMSDTGIVNSGTDTTIGLALNVTRTGATGGTIRSVGIVASAEGDTGGSSSGVAVQGTASGADTMIGIHGQATSTIDVARDTGIGVNGVVNTLFSLGSSLTSAYALQGQITMTNGGGAIFATAAGLNIVSSDIGTGGTITNNYGILVNTQTAGTNDYGIRIDTADTQTLWLSGNADSTTANAGIAFGQSRDTNLYRGAANTLRTDDLLSVGGGVTVPGAGTNSERFGASAVAAGNESLAVGNNASAGSAFSVVVGRSATVSGANTVAVGYTAAANTAAVAIGASASADQDGIAIGSAAVTSANDSIAIGRSATAIHSDSIVIGKNAASTTSGQFVVGSTETPIANVFFGSGVAAASPQNTVINATGGSGTDVAGANLTLAAGRGTGAADGGSLLFQTTAGSGSSSSQRNLATILTLTGGSGAATFQNIEDSTSGFKVMDADGGISVFNVDTSNERVGIGVDAPTVSLDVLSAGADGTTVAQFMNAGAESCTVQPGGTGFSCSSDARLKTNIATVVDPLETIRGLRGVTFNWNSDPSGQAHVGFIAQELEQLIPSAVSTDSRGYKVANYTAIIPYLVGAAQAQDMQLTALEQSSAAQQQAAGNLGGRVNELEQQVASLQQGSDANLPNLNVSGKATISTLKVTGTATVASLTVTGDATFAGDIQVQGNLRLAGKVLGNESTRGKVTIAAGETQAEYDFAEAFSAVPNVILTATNSFAPPYRVEATTTGFKVYLESPVANNVTFNYHAQQ